MGFIFPHFFFWFLKLGSYIWILWILIFFPLPIQFFMIFLGSIMERDKYPFGVSPSLQRPQQCDSAFSIKGWFSRQSGLRRANFHLGCQPRKWWQSSAPKSSVFVKDCHLHCHGWKETGHGIHWTILGLWLLERGQNKWFIKKIPNLQKP